MEVLISQYFHWNYITGLSPPGNLGFDPQDKPGDWREL